MSGLKIGIVGAGNVGSHLCRAFSKAGHQIVVYTRRGADHLLNDVSGLVWTKHLSSFRRGYDFIIIAINDDSIGNVAAELNPEEGIILHTSGSTEMDILKRSNSSNYGVFYPLQSFRKDLALNYAEIPVFIEGNTKNTLNKIKILAESFSKNVVEMESDQRKRLHLAAVIVNNFSNHLYCLSQEYLNKHKITFDHLLPLIKETASRLDVNKASEMQTGPAMRNDSKIMNEHRKMLESKDELLSIYELISSSITNRYK